MTKPSFLFREVEVVLLRPGEAAKRKEAFTKKIKREFKDLAAASMMVDRASLKGKHVHHQTPVELNGDPIDFNNLAVVPEKLHRKIHAYLDLETRGMRPGDRRKIRIPYQMGWVWR